MMSKDSLNFTNCEVLHEGLSNKSFLIDDIYVMRQKSVNHDPFFNPASESTIIEQLKGQPFVEKVISYDEKTGNKLSFYIPGTTRLAKPIEKKELKYVAELLKQFHSLHLKIEAEFSPFKRLSFYKKGIQSEIESTYEKSCVENACKLYEKYPLIVAHNDLVCGNLLFKDAHVYLLDFEFAGRNIAIFDLASFLSENNITDDENIIYFCSCYGDADVNDVKTMMKFEDILWYYWAKRLFNETGNPVFNSIAKDKLLAL